MSLSDLDAHNSHVSGTWSRRDEWAHTVHPPLGISLEWCRVRRSSNDMSFTVLHFFWTSGPILFVYYWTPLPKTGRFCFIVFALSTTPFSENHLFLSSWLSQNWNPEIPQHLRLISLSSFSPPPVPIAMVDRGQLWLFLLQGFRISVLNPTTPREALRWGIRSDLDWRFLHGDIPNNLN